MGLLMSMNVRHRAIVCPGSIKAVSGLSRTKGYMFSLKANQVVHA